MAAFWLNDVIQRKTENGVVSQSRQPKPVSMPMNTGLVSKNTSSHHFGSIPLNAPKGNMNMNRIPDRLKNNVEAASGMDMSDVKVQYNSPAPAILGALAYAQTNEIYLRSGQEKYLPHEVWHIVQQKQGRVMPTIGKANGISISDDTGLEKEADQMGEKLSKGNMPKSMAFNNGIAKKSAVQQNIIQRKKVSTDFGEFETTKFAEAEARGVGIDLAFNPDETKVDATKIALSQSLKKTLASGGAYAIDPNQATRMVAGGKSGEGYAIDQLTDVNSPLYIQNTNLGAGQDLKDTPQSADKQLGFCFKEKPTDAKKKKQPALLSDEPKGGKHKGESKIFETAALAIDGTDKGKYYGSVKWGYKMEGTEAVPTVNIMDIEKASMGTPTANFIEPAKLWNAAKTRGTLKVSADPEAIVLKGDASGTEKLAKDKKLKQLETSMWGTNPSIKAEVLKDDGTGSGKIIYIKNVDVIDMGDGVANKQLPIPTP